MEAWDLAVFCVQVQFGHTRDRAHPAKPYVTASAVPPALFDRTSMITCCGRYSNIERTDRDAT